jgi:hypothetical protein
MIDKSLFFIFIIWYFYNYLPPHVSINFLIRCYYLCDNLFIYLNKIINSEYCKDQQNIEDSNETVKEPLRYEDKYLEDIRRINKEWVFTEDENNELPRLIEDFYNIYIETRMMRIEEINKRVSELEKEISQDRDDINYVENCDDEGDELICENTLEERNNIRKSQIEELREEVIKIKLETDTEEINHELKKNCEENARQNIINRRLDKLINCYVMEKTPIGNVIMIYQKDKESFKYYSDCNIPYRYLEVVARKYVKLFNCRPIFVDMEEELRLFEEKWEKDQESKKIKEDEEKKRSENMPNNEKNEQKKNVFAKFKSYNKDAGGKISMAAPPKNNIPNKIVSENKENEKILLKERANRYTYEGKFANFNFLQKIERKVFNKKLGLTFADFKKMKK